MIEAAGGVVWNETGDRILLVHRPRYGDWTLPKGKLDPGESHATAAAREVTEETGFETARGAQLAELRYVTSDGAEKRVVYFTFHVTGGEFVPNDEVDAVQWTTVTQAGALLSYEIDRTFIATVPK